MANVQAGPGKGVGAGSGTGTSGCKVVTPVCTSNEYVLPSTGVKLIPVVLIDDWLSQTLSENSTLTRVKSILSLRIAATVFSKSKVSIAPSLSLSETMLSGTTTLAW